MLHEKVGKHGTRNRGRSIRWLKVDWTDFNKTFRTDFSDVTHPYFTFSPALRVFSSTAYGLPCLLLEVLNFLSHFFYTQQIPNGHTRQSVPNLAQNPMQGTQPLSMSIRSLNQPPPPQESRNNNIVENGYHPNVKQQIAMAIRSGQSPYAIYGLQDQEDDDWC